MAGKSTKKRQQMQKGKAVTHSKGCSMATDSRMVTVKRSNLVKVVVRPEVVSKMPSETKTFAERGLFSGVFSGSGRGA